MGRKGHDRINVFNNPVNLIDPLGLEGKRWSRHIFEIVPGIESLFMAHSYKLQMRNAFRDEYSRRMNFYPINTWDRQTTEVWNECANKYSWFQAFFHSYACTVDENFQRYFQKSIEIQKDIEGYERIRLQTMYDNLDLYCPE